MLRKQRGYLIVIYTLSVMFLASCDLIDRYALEGTFTFSKNGKPEIFSLSEYTRYKIRIDRGSMKTYYRGKEYESYGDILSINFYYYVGRENEKIKVNLSRIHEHEMKKNIQITDTDILSYETIGGETIGGIIPGTNSDVSGYLRYIDKYKLEWDVKIHYYGHDSAKNTDDDILVEFKSNGPVKVKTKYTWELMPFLPVHP